MVVKTGRIAPLTPALRKMIAGLAAAAALSLALLCGCAPAPAASSSATSASPEASSSAAVSAASSSAQSQSAASDAQTIAVAVEIADPAGPEAAPTSYPVEVSADDATVLAALQATGVDATIEDSEYGKYISALNGTAAEGTSGWIYTVNGQEVMESADQCQLAAGDTVEFQYITM